MDGQSRLSRTMAYYPWFNRRVNDGVNCYRTHIFTTNAELFSE
jgi:hypothetical protein